jgi:16S rRNA (adenine1518-N6/adenine1519-N6)-dimethyltransferase
MHKKPKLGQNFLADENILRKIVAFIKPDSTDVILEIGAGTGALTRQLATQAGKLIAVEIDRDLLPHLEVVPGITVVHQDILELDLGQYSQSGKLRIVGNLPYYISTPVLTGLIQQKDHVKDMILMFQEEVAQRILATPSTSEYGYLSVLCQYFCRIEKGFRISRNCFRPIPEVESRILRFEFRPESRCRYDEYTALLRAAFSQRRKRLAKNLMSYPGASPDKISAAFSKLNIGENARAENLPPAEFESLLIELSTNQGPSPEPRFPKSRII